MQREITSLGGGKKVLLRQTPRAVPPWGGRRVLVEFLKRRGYTEPVGRQMPSELKSPNASEPARTFTAFLGAVRAGARRFAPAGRWRADRSLPSRRGRTRFPSDDTIRNWFQRFRPAAVYRFFSPRWEGPWERRPKRQAGYRLDWDSPGLERYGRQEGARKGCNPKQHGRAAHHPRRAVLGEASFLLPGGWRSGNGRAARGGRPGNGFG